MSNVKIIFRRLFKNKIINLLLEDYIEQKNITVRWFKKRSKTNQWENKL